MRILSTLAASVLLTYPGFSSGLEPAEIYDRARAASVEILVDGRLAGSGWFASADGHAFTAAHVVRKAGVDSVTVATPEHGELPARVVAVDPSHDLALIKVDVKKTPGAGDIFLPISDELPDPGDIVFLFGSAVFRHEVMIRGSVARRRPTYEFLTSQRHYIRCMHISAPSPLGTSGGCWVDHEGKVIGLQSAFLSKDGHGMGIAFASVPDAIKGLLKSETTRVAATLGCGIEESVSQPKAFMARFPKGTRGLVPVLRAKGGPVDVGALRGDLVITHLDGVATPSRDPFLEAIRAKDPGDKVRLTILRPSSAKAANFVVTLGGI